MQSDDKPINGQPNPSFLDLLAQAPPPPDTDLNKDHGTKRFAQLRAGWNTTWEQGGFLHGSGDPTGSRRNWDSVM
ncbi:hypothetical protein [Streptomyces sp. NPDC058268]|uniref:hypothetical protein n=1 Tax=Streptomyces sp. NPDC058268 TaxID=3346413 RepID=UPI0036F005DD